MRSTVAWLVAMAAALGCDDDNVDGGLTSRNWFARSVHWSAIDWMESLTRSGAMSIEFRRVDEAGRAPIRCWVRTSRAASRSIGTLALLRCYGEIALRVVVSAVRRPEPQPYW